MTNTIVVRTNKGIPGPQGPQGSAGPVGPMGPAGGFSPPKVNVDPANPTDGDIWYRIDLDVYKARRNGVTETLNTSGITIFPLYTGSDPLNPPEGFAWIRTDLKTLNIIQDGQKETIFTTAYNTGGGSGGDNLPSSPGELLRLGTGDGMNHFNLGIGLNSGHIDIPPATLASGYTNSPYFKLSPDKMWAVMRAPVSGGTTSVNTQYARTEFREFNEAANDEISFDCSTGTHWIKGRTKLVHLEPAKPWVVIAQMHDDDDDVVKIMTRVVSGTTKLMLTVRNATISTPLIDPIGEGDEFDWEIRFVNGTMTIWINGVLKHTDSTSFDTALEGQEMYFKAGCYNQSNETTATDSDDYFEIWLRDLQHFHTGWPVPLAVWDFEGEGSEPLPAVGAWTNLTMSNANVVSRTGGYPTAAVRKESGDKRAFLRGGLEATGANANGAILATVPVGFRPAAGSFVVEFPGRHSGGTAVLTVNEAGEIKLANAFNNGTPNAWLTLDNVSYPID